MVKRITLWILLFLISPTIFPTDSDGHFAVRNAGLVKCELYIEEKRRKSNKFNLYMGWVDGYISAANQYTEDTYDLIPWGNSVFLATLLENYCKKNPNERFFKAVNKLLAVMAANRIERRTEIVETKHNGKKTYIYRKVLKDIQSKLKSEKYYSGNGDGHFNNATIEALESYQKANNLVVTGLPDQPTLYTILMKNNK